MASFEGIKVGDEVVIQPPVNRWHRYVTTVLRVTAAQFKVEGYAFRKKDGRHIGGNVYHRARVYQATPELLAEIETERRYRKAHENLIGSRNQLETLTRDIDNTYDKHLLAETMEVVAADLAAAVAKLREAMP